MLNNAGNKIILWSKIVLCVGIALSLALGFFLVWHGAQANTFRVSVYRMGYLYDTGFVGGNRAIIAGFLVIVFGSLASWLAALLLRAFGDLTIDAKAIRRRLEWGPVPPMRHAEPMEPKPDMPEWAPAPPNPPEESAEAEPEKPAAPVRKRAKKPAAPKTEEPAKPEEG